MRTIATGHLAKLVIASAIALGLSACGNGPIVSRPGDAWQCGQQLRKTPKADPLLGWVSISSLDRWIAAVDRIGQRAGQFAPGSSVRATAMAMAEDRADAMGIKNLRWIDMTRPIHALLQADQKNPILGVSVVLPITDQAKAREATARLHTDFQAKGHDLVLDLQKSGAAGTGRKPLWVHWLDHGTALSALSPARLTRAKVLGKCVETRQPRELLHVGVAVADLLKRHRRRFNAAKQMLLKMAKKTGQNDAVIAHWSKKMVDMLDETDAAMLLASAGEDDVSIGIRVNARANSELAKGWAKQTKLGPNTLATMLPGDAWLAVTQSYDPSEMRKDLDDMVRMYGAMLKLPQAQLSTFKSQMTEMIGLIGPHSAGAFYRERQFPMGMYFVWQSSNPERLRQVLGDVVLTAMQAGLTSALTKVNNPKKTAIVEAATSAMAKGWHGMVGELIAKSATWPVRISHPKSAAGSMPCHTLRLTPNAALLAKMAINRGMMKAFLPRKLDLSVCTGAGGLHFAFGGNATARIAQHATRRHQSVVSQPWFVRASTLAGKKAHSVMAINPAPLLEIARAMMPQMPDWPEAASISTACRYAVQSVRCDVRIPVAIADFVAKFRGKRTR